MKSKKAIVLLLTASMILSFTACAFAKVPSEENSQQHIETAEAENILQGDPVTNCEAREFEE